MFKVLIVDDEPIIRKGLVNIIDWKRYNCMICGEAGDGLDGIEKIKELKPDIVFADINMPEVDGLTMIKEIRKMIPHVIFIILTGYRDFDNIYEAMKLGAFDYILKPSKIEEVNDVLKRAQLQLQHKYAKEEEIKEIKSHFEKSLPMLREKLLYDIIFKINTNKEEILENAELYDIKVNNFISVVVEIDEEEEGTRSQYERQLYQFGIINTFEEMFEETFNIIKMPLNNKRVVFIIQPLDDRKEFEKAVNDRVEKLQKLIKNCFDFTITVGVSTKGRGLFDLSERIEECINSLEYKFYIGKDSLILYEDIKSFFKGKDDTALHEKQKEMLKYIKSGNEESVQKVLREINKIIKEEKLLDREALKAFYFSTIQLINNIRVSVKSQEGKEILNEGMPSIFQLIDQCENIDELSALLEDVSLNMVSRIDVLNKKNINFTIERAKEYLNTHYNESITLNEVAEYAFVSTFYLSRMFKKELGKNFVDYLNEIRVAKAKEYLKDEQYKAYEIAEKVGIQDPHYFSKLFKKYTGMTPTEYRLSNIPV